MTEPAITVEGERWLSESQHAWEELHRNAAADALFLSWDWHCHWWKWFGRDTGGTPEIMVARDDFNTIVGLAPFYSCSAIVSRALRLRRLQFMGNIWGVNTGVITEHVDWIVRRGYEKSVADAFLNHLMTRADWDDLLLTFTRGDAVLSGDSESNSAFEQCYVREQGRIDSYAIDTTAAFDSFTASLNSAVRAKMINRRSRLHSAGVVDVSLATRSNFEAFLSELFRLYAARWRCSVPQKAQGFLRDMSAIWSERGQLRLSQLGVAGRVISVILGVTVDGVEYNLQSAFDPQFDNKLSPGLLHLGYQIERAFCSDTDSYDLLAGGGKSTQFKRRIASVSDTFVSRQYVKNGFHKVVYRCYDALKR